MSRRRTPVSCAGITRVRHELPGGRILPAREEPTAGPTPGDCKYVAFAPVPAGTRQALVRYAGTNRNATGILNFRIDADYREPFGGFHPVRVIYTWQENGQAKQHIHIAQKAQETYAIHCAVQPVMKAVVVELAE